LGRVRQRLGGCGATAEAQGQQAKG
jgi:hypothetical protein